MVTDQSEYKLIKVEADQVRLEVDGVPCTAQLDDVRQAARDLETPIGRFSARLLAEIERQLRDQERARLWYALVTFGEPAAELAADRVAFGLAGLARLRQRADAAKGSRSCSEARVVARATREDALAADIADGGVVYCA